MEKCKCVVGPLFGCFLRKSYTRSLEDFAQISMDDTNMPASQNKKHKLARYVLERDMADIKECQQKSVFDKIFG